MIEIRHRYTGQVLHRIEGSRFLHRLKGASLGTLDLRGLDLRWADLGGRDLTGVDLRGANLCGADLRGSGGNQPIGGSFLVGAQLEGALYDAETRWPLFFNPRRRGCIRVDTELSPSMPPEGRGDEASPTGSQEQAHGARLVE